MNRKQRRADGAKSDMRKLDPLDELYNEAFTLHTSLKLVEAADLYKKILAVNPRHADSLHMLGLMSYQGGSSATGIALINEALKIREDANFHNNIASAYKKLSQLEEAATHLRKAIALQPDFAGAISNLASVLKSQGKLDEALEHYRRALDLAPDSYMSYNSFLLSMIYAESVTPEELAATARKFAETLADPLMPETFPTRDPSPERRLRIGYVSPDFCNHSVNYFFEPLLDRHDRNDFEIFAYSSTLGEDAVRTRLKTKFDHWRDITLLDDVVAAEVIEEDKIDILIDMAGHTGNNRLLVFARKPAPVQVAWLGYPATTGLKTIDYRITDSYADPPGMTEHLNVETLWRLPHMFCCYKANERNPAVIDHPPFEDNGYVTFGCFNNFARVSDSTLEAWSQILQRIPDSRLLLEIAGLENIKFRTDVEKKLEARGLPLARVLLEPRKPENQFVLYNRLDIALDPFPSNGGTTSMDTLWMGVPLISKAGNQFFSRIGASVLSNAGLPELIAQTVEEYIQCAVNLATDRERLKNMRHHLRDRITKSPLMDEKAFAKNMEDAYRAMWRAWCSTQEQNSPKV